MLVMSLEEEVEGVKAIYGSEIKSLELSEDLFTLTLIITDSNVSVLLSFTLKDPLQFLNPAIPTIGVFSDQLPQERLQQVQDYLISQSALINENFLYSITEKCREFLQQRLQSDWQPHLGGPLTKEASATVKESNPPPEVYFKREEPETPEYKVQRPEKGGHPSLYVNEQLEEIKALKEKFSSFKSVQHPDLLAFAIRLAPTKVSKTNLLVVDVMFALTSQYPHDYPDIAVTCLESHGTKKQAKGLANFLTTFAKRNYGRKQVFEILHQAKIWIIDQNNAWLIKNGYIQYLKERGEGVNEQPEPQEVVFDLLQFELEGKQRLVNLACNGLVTDVSVGSFWTERKMNLVKSVYMVAYSHPEFILQLALYVRKNLGIRETANMLVALACNIGVCHPYVKKYFPDIIRLPKDLLHVVDYMNEIPTYARIVPYPSLPNCLRVCVQKKFAEFDEYQLAKYCSEGNRKRILRTQRVPSQDFVKKFKQTRIKDYDWEKPTLSKREKMTMKRLIRQTHISQPRKLVLKVLGAKYPSNPEDFQKSGLEGEWNSAKAGKRMKLKSPATWEVLASQMGNCSKMWEYLIDQNKLPFLAMLRNLRNILYTGVSAAHHAKLIKILLDKERVIASKILPTQFLHAYDAVNIDLKLFARAKKFVIKSHKLLKRGLIRDRELAKRGVCSEEEAAKNLKARNKNLKTKIKTLFGLPGDFSPQGVPSKKILSDYRHAIDFAMKLASNHNQEKIKGFTMILCDVGSSMDFGFGGKVASRKAVTRKAAEVAIYLSLLLKAACDKGEVHTFSNRGTTRLRLDDTTSSIPAMVSKILHHKDTGYPNDETNFPYSVLDDLFVRRETVENIVVISSMMIKSHNLLRKDFVNPLLDQVARLRKKVNPEMNFFAVDLQGTGCSIVEPSPEGVENAELAGGKNTIISGFSGEIVRFIAAKATQISVIEGLEPRAGAQEEQQDA